MAAWPATRVNQFYVPMRLALLTNRVPDYRVATFLALKQRVEHLAIILSEPSIAPGLENSGIEIRVAPTLRIPAVRRHDTGYLERYQIHVPHGVVAELRRARPDCVFAVEFGIRTAWAAWFRWRTGTPLVVHADLSAHTERGRGRIRPIVRRGLLRQADAILTNGASGVDYLSSLGVDRERVSLLPYATDVQHFGPVLRTPDDDSVLRLLYVGRLVELKGLEPWLATLGAVLEQRPALRVRMTIAGDGDRRAALEQMPHPANLELDFLGAVPYAELPRIYAGADAFVMPSLGDTWGLVINEAMASGLPVLGSEQTQAVLELVREGIDGWRFDAGDAGSVRAAIERCLSVPIARWRSMGDNAREAAMTVSPEYVASALLAGCRRAMAGSRKDSK